MVKTVKNIVALAITVIFLLPTSSLAETEAEVVQRILSVSPERALVVLDELNSVVSLIQPKLKRFKSLTHALAYQDLGSRSKLASFSYSLAALVGGRTQFAVGEKRFSDKVMPVIRLEAAIGFGIGSLSTLAIVNDRRQDQTFARLNLDEPAAAQIGFVLAMEESKLEGEGEVFKRRKTKEKALVTEVKSEERYQAGGYDFWSRLSREQRVRQIVKERLKFRDLGRAFMAKGFGLGVGFYSDVAVIIVNLPLPFLKVENEKLKGRYLEAVGSLARILKSIAELEPQDLRMELSFIEQDATEFAKAVEELEQEVMKSSSYQGYAAIAEGLDLSDQGVFSSGLSLLVAREQAHVSAGKLGLITKLPKSNELECRTILSL